MLGGPGPVARGMRVVEPLVAAARVDGVVLWIVPPLPRRRAGKQASEQVFPALRKAGVNREQAPARVGDRRAQPFAPHFGAHLGPHFGAHCGAHFGAHWAAPAVGSGCGLASWAAAGSASVAAVSAASEASFSELFMVGFLLSG